MKHYPFVHKFSDKFLVVTTDELAEHTLEGFILINTDQEHRIACYPLSRTYDSYWDAQFFLESLKSTGVKS